MIRLYLVPGCDFRGLYRFEDRFSIISLMTARSLRHGKEGRAIVVSSIIQRVHHAISYNETSYTFGVDLVIRYNGCRESV